MTVSEELPTLSEGAEDHHAPWWQHTAQFIFTDYMSLVALMAVAVLFEFLHERLEVFVHKTKSRYASPLWHRVNSEFMVLGFIAFVAWIISRASGFERMANSSHDVLTLDGPSLLHLVEDVHMRLFMSMLLYFFIMIVLVLRAEQHIRGWCFAWETKELERRAAEKGSSASKSGSKSGESHGDEKGKVIKNPYFTPSTEAEYYNAESKFSAWLREQDFSKIRFDGKKVSNEALHKLLENFNLAAYLTIALEELLVNLTHISNPVWAGVGALYLILGLTSGYAPASDTGEFWKILGVGYFVMLLMVCLLLFNLYQYKFVKRPEEFDDDSCFGKYHIEVIFARFLQIGLFFCCYSIIWFSSAEPSHHGYLQDSAYLAIVIVAYFFPFFCLVLIFFPYLLPRFVAVVRLPPFVDAEDYKLIIHIALGKFHKAYFHRLYPPAHHHEEHDAHGHGHGHDAHGHGHEEHHEDEKDVINVFSSSSSWSGDGDIDNRELSDKVEQLISASGSGSKSGSKSGSDSN